MNYKETLEYIHSVSWKGSRPGLERITELCERMGNPQNSLRFVHVAGTNGKGSVSAMTSSVLSAAGYKTGLFTSPYLVDFCERMSIDGKDISHESLCESVERVKPHADEMIDAPTEFELITAVALDYFSKEKCDIVVFECGMGGRLDSTNVIEAPEAAVITNIALDHISFLGDTEEKIACEKAGIIKEKKNSSLDVILGGGTVDVKRVFEEKCRETNSSLFTASEEISISDVTNTRNGIKYTYKNEEYFVPLCGLYQNMNIKTVLGTVEALRKNGWIISDEALRHGLASVKWRGRFETLWDEPRVIFDGAHNPDGAAFTASTFNTLYPGEKAVIISGVMADKDSSEMASSFAETGDTAFVFKPDNPRAMEACEYALVLKKAGINATPCESALDAVRKGVHAAKERNCPVLCAGSLYMYGEVFKAVNEVCGK